MTVLCWEAAFGTNSIDEAKDTYIDTSLEKHIMPFDIEKCARPNILALEPYRCARELVIANLSNNEKLKHGP